MVDDYGLVEFADDLRDASDEWDRDALEAVLEADDRANRDALGEELP